MDGLCMETKMSDTPFTDQNSWYGEYVKKSSPVVFASQVRELERNFLAMSYRAKFAECDMEKAHKVLDQIGLPRVQPNGLLPYSIVGRLNLLMHNVEHNRHLEAATPLEGVRVDGPVGPQREGE